MTDFDYDVMQRKRLAHQARYKKNGSKSRKCTLPHDSMSKKEWKERNGDVVVFNMKEPTTWKVFKKLSASTQEEYISYLIGTYHISIPMFAGMLGVSSGTIHKYIASRDIGVKFYHGNSVNSDEKLAFYAFLNGCAGESEVVNDKAAEDDAPEEKALVEVTEPVTVPQRAPGGMEQFNIKFSGALDVQNIVNSLVWMLGNHTDGELEIRYDHQHLSC